MYFLKILAVAILFVNKSSIDIISGMAIMDKGRNIQNRRVKEMKIAVTYDNGKIFQHFGRTEQFKVYEVEDNKVVSSEVIGSNGVGHGALAGLLSDRSVDVLICGGIGGGAQAALAEAGVELCAGAQGDADQAVEAYLKGELVSTGANCDHHGEGHTCGDHEEGHSCGSGCGDSCGGGCGAHTTLTGRNVGKTCRTHYRGTFNDGTQFDSSYDRGEPLEFVCGAGQMIKGFDAAVADMEVGQVVDVHLMPEEAYGCRIRMQSLPLKSHSCRVQRSWRQDSRYICPISSDSRSL